MYELEQIKPDLMAPVQHPVSPELEMLRSALTGAGDIVFRWTKSDDRLSWLGSLERLFGSVDQNMVASQQLFHEFLEDDAIETRSKAQEKARTTREPYSIRYRIFQMTGEIEWIEERASLEIDDGGKVVGATGVLRVVTEWRKREEVLVKRARYDDLTGLLSRGELISAILRALEQVSKNDGKAVYFLVGIDNLAIINGAYGFDVADEVIVSIGHRIQSCLGPEDQIGRMGGNAYGIICRESGTQSPEELANRMLEVVRETVIETPAGPVSTTISIGCLDLNESDYASNQVLAHAEDALAAAKEGGRDRVVFYAPSSIREENRRKNIATTELVVSALRQERLVLAYQPIVDAVTKEVRHHECLLRMVLPDGNIISAGGFIPSIESLGLVRLVDRRTLELAVQTLETYAEARLTLNVSALTVSDSTWIGDLVSFLRHQPEVARRLTIEITETAAMDDEEQAIKFVHTIHGLGCGVALDDFGAGYTSFRHLKSLGLDIVKIDGSFVRGVLEDEDNQMFVRTLLGLAKNLNLTTVAEFVSSDEEIDLLHSFGCDYVQGFHVGVPVLSPPWENKADHAGLDFPAKLNFDTSYVI